MTENNTEKKEYKTYTNYDIFPGKIRLITKEGNYAYPIESMNQLEKILLQGNNRRCDL